MYVTRPLSRYYNSPDAVFEPPPEGPNSGILVIEDEEAEAQARCCWGLCKNRRISVLPFPQNRRILVEYSTVSGVNSTVSGVNRSGSHENRFRSGENRSTHRDKFFFIPVVGTPMSSSCYYVIKASGKHKGKICECSKEEDMSTFCLCRCVNDVKPSPFDYTNIYQQVQLSRRHRGQFNAKAVAFDGFPPSLLRRRDWEAYTSSSTYYYHEALGINTNLRAQMPNLKFPISSKYSPAVVVGKWWCPYIFVNEDGYSLQDQMKSSMFYEMTLEQFWENVYTAENFYGNEGNVVEVGVSVVREMPLLGGNEVVSGINIEAGNGVIWFKPLKPTTTRSLGLSSLIWERMKWEEERGGWVGGDRAVEERMERVESYGGDGGWRMFGYFVLVERFVLRRMDGSLALTYDFRHTNKVRTRWE